MRKHCSAACLLAFLAAVLLPAAAGAQQQNMPKPKEYRIERGMPPQAVACIECHKQENPGIFSDWAMSRHASANVTCLDCHQAQPGDKDISQEHFKQYERSDTKWGKGEYKIAIAGVVTPKDCSRCHPDEAMQYSKSKHANTLEVIWKIDPWLNNGMNNAVERASGCYVCHGTVLKQDENGKLDPLTWPNVGVGRVQPGRLPGQLHELPHPAPVLGHGGAQAREPAASATSARTTRRSRYTSSPSTATSTTAFKQDQYNWNAAPGSLDARRGLPLAHLRRLPHVRLGFR